MFQSIAMRRYWGAIVGVWLLVAVPAAADPIRGRDSEEQSEKPKPKAKEKKPEKPVTSEEGKGCQGEGGKPGKNVE